jgi:hypothetical protein
MLGRTILAAGGVLLLAAACIHAMGLPMASGWGEGLGRQEHQAICLMWANASVGWAVVSLLWLVTAWRRGAWLGAAAVAALIPAYGGAGVMYIDPTFFGGQMLAGSVLLAILGLLLLRRGVQS